MPVTRTVKILYTLWLLSENDLTKNEIIEKHSKANMGETNSYSISSCIKTLIKNGFKITSKRKGRNLIYHLEQENFSLKLNQKEIDLLEKIKKIIISQKNIKTIRRIIVFFYKFILAMDNNDFKNILIDFEYYSNINWYLVNQLEKHCISKDVILIDYAHYIKHGVKLKLHVNNLSINEWSDKIYLWGELYDNGELSFLPVEKIFMIDKILERKVPFKLPINEIRYKISNKLYKEIELDKEEKLEELTKDYAIIKRHKNNKFYIIQRLMSFCPELYYISDDEIKKEVIKRLKLLRKNYG